MSIMVWTYYKILAIEKTKFEDIGEVRNFLARYERLKLILLNFF